MDVKGKTAIVTGSAVGVGRATALDLARRGANVVINYSRSEDDAREAVCLVEAEGGEALLVKADVSKDDQVRGMVFEPLALHFRFRVNGFRRQRNVAKEAGRALPRPRWRK